MQRCYSWWAATHSRENTRSHLLLCNGAAQTPLYKQAHCWEVYSAVLPGIKWAHSHCVCARVCVCVPQTWSCCLQSTGAEGRQQRWTALTGTDAATSGSPLATPDLANQTPCRQTGAQNTICLAVFGEMGRAQGGEAKKPFAWHFDLNSQWGSARINTKPNNKKIKLQKGQKTKHFTRSLQLHALAFASWHVRAAIRNAWTGVWGWNYTFEAFK